MLDEWFEKRTFHHQDFADLSQLCNLKEEQALTISLGLPTLNVEKTLGKILATIKRELQEKKPLLDEIAIIDSHSWDQTTQIAEDLGVKVFFDDEIMISGGFRDGKGEALWKSLYALEGDIIVWVDSDIENIHPRFVYGLVGPLLSHPEIGFIKGFYQRPIRTSAQSSLKKTGGGRVTEIVARPVLNLFYPELAGFLQPLAGEYGGRREVLEKVPFFTGYAVEIGLLVEIWRKFGLMRMAQVDLERRVHFNQPLSSLSKMSFAILQAVFAFLEADKKIKLNTELSSLLHTLQYEEGKYSLEEHLIKIFKRPPIETIPEYQEKYKIRIG